ncbi:MAG: ATP-dependent Clp protease adaptor ClpS [Bacteroidota bacterium]|nr:ATP-dependent Clp protease adaptor ClpS [Bacteroidota bacterium]
MIPYHQLVGSCQFGQGVLLTFEWVIETLIRVCGHTEEQAEQCALLIHTQGKYAVKKGDYDTLKPMCDAITDRGIGATIEAVTGN